MSENVTAFPETEEAQLSALSAMLDAEETPKAPAEPGKDVPEAEETAPPEGDQPEAETEAEPEETPAIDAPNSWSKEDREVFASLPPEAQAIVARRETQRDTEIRRVQNEAAQARQAAQAEVQQAAQERAYLAQHVAPVLQQLTSTLQNDFSPQKLAQLAATDPTKYVQALSQREMLMTQQQMLAQEQNRQMETVRTAEMQRLLDAVPEWKEPAKFREAAVKLRNYGIAQGFTQAEIDQTIDHRSLAVLDKARRFDELMAARKAPAAKVVQPSAPRVVKAPQRTDGETANTTKRDAYRNIARNGSADEQVAALAAMLSKG
jgi:hypothetical protein